jgi:hypothetical protein
MQPETGMQAQSHTGIAYVYIEPQIAVIVAWKESELTPEMVKSS